jgi:hypothetical protein
MSTAEAPKPVQILFAGSSSTYWNDLPAAVAQVLQQRASVRPGAPVQATIAGRSGDDIRVYLQPGFARYEYGVPAGQTFLEQVRERQPDWLVLQVVCGFILKETAAGEPTHAEAVTRYCAAVRAVGGAPVFYEMGWSKKPTEAEGRARILALARAQKVRYFAPCSSAWARVYHEKPMLALQHPQDGAHPGDAGHFLNLACFYAALTGTSPVGQLPRTFAVWPHGPPKPTTDAAKQAEAELVAKFQPSAYQAQMPKWMYRHMAVGLTATLDEATAKYLETVAWETWQQVQKQLTLGE